jgi:hypothetical protein
VIFTNHLKKVSGADLHQRVVGYRKMSCPKNLGKVVFCCLLQSLILFFSNTGDNYTGVIILTYMRSGSSVTGDILQQNNNVFYVFEPLRILQDLIKHEKPVQWFNGTIRCLQFYYLSHLLITKS